MEELPLSLLDAVPESEWSAVRLWWAGLLPADQRLVGELYDEGWEVCFFGPAADDPPAVRGGRFLVADDAWQFEAWEADWREYLVEHPDVFLAAMFHSRCFRDGDGSVCVEVDWGRTRFSGPELPPSEQRPG